MAGSRHMSRRTPRKERAALALLLYTAADYGRASVSRSRDAQFVS
jgi:hypothetical protein